MFMVISVFKFKGDLYGVYPSKYNATRNVSVLRVCVWLCNIRLVYLYTHTHTYNIHVRCTSHKVYICRVEMCNVQCTFHIVHCDNVAYALCTVYSVHCTLYTVQCTALPVSCYQ